MDTKISLVAITIVAVSMTLFPLIVNQSANAVTKCEDESGKSHAWIEGCKQGWYSDHDHCKSNMFQYILHRFGISLADSVAVGDGQNDICMVKMAGTGISFNSITPEVDAVADYTFRDQSLKPVLEVIR